MFVSLFLRIREKLLQIKKKKEKEKRKELTVLKKSETETVPGSRAFEKVAISGEIVSTCFGQVLLSDHFVGGNVKGKRF